MSLSLQNLPILGSKRPADAAGARSIPIQARRIWLQPGYTIVFHLEAESLQQCIVRRGLRGHEVIDLSKTYVPAEFQSAEKWGECLGSEIQSTLRRPEAKHARFILSVSGSQTVLRMLRLPTMPAGELERAVRLEGAKRAPFPLEEAYYGFTSIQRVITPGADERIVALTAVERRVVDEFLDFFSKRGVTFDRVVQDTAAIGRLFSRFDGYRDTRVYGTLQIKSRSAEVAFYQGNQLRFLQRAAIGSEQLSSAQRSGDKETIARVFERFTESLIQELQNCLDFYSAQGAAENVDSLETIYIHGDLAYSNDLIARLNTQFDIRFEQYPSAPLSTLLGESGAHADIAPTALSALAVAVNTQETTELSPESMRRAREWRGVRRAMVGLAVATLTVWGMLIGSAVMRNESYAVAEESAIAQIRNLEQSPGMAIYRALERRLTEAARTQNPSTSQEYSLALKELSRLTPPSIHLSRFDFDRSGLPTRCELAGIVVPSAASTEPILATYMTALGSSPVFDSVTLAQESRTPDGASLSFTLSLVVRI